MLNECLEVMEKRDRECSSGEAATDGGGSSSSNSNSNSGGNTQVFILWARHKNFTPNSPGWGITSHMYISVSAIHALANPMHLTTFFYCWGKHSIQDKLENHGILGLLFFKMLPLNTGGILDIVFFPVTLERWNLWLKIAPMVTDSPVITSCLQMRVCRIPSEGPYWPSEWNWQH